MATTRDKTAVLAAAGTAAAAAAGIGIKRLRDTDGDAADSTAYRLLEGEPVGPGIRRILQAQVEDAVVQLRGEAGTGPAEGIHEARKDMKKIRSALRLVRDAIGEDAWRRENDHYRDVARKLSAHRDAEILVSSLDGLRERCGPAARQRSEQLREQLDAENRVAHDDGTIERTMASASAELIACRSSLDELALDGDGWEMIALGIHRSYRAAESACARSRRRRASPTSTSCASGSRTSGTSCG